MDFSKLDGIMEEMPQRGIPSCEIAVAYKGETVYRKSVGYADHEKTRPSSPEDIYWIFSCSKIITCVAGMRLVERGIIRLDDPVSKYIPEFEDLKVRDTKTGELSDAKTTMTVEHLFTMSGGLDYNFKATPIAEAIEAEGADTLSIVRAMAKEPLWFEPGENFKYSLCHDVLGAVIEVVSGMKYSEYLQKEIFDPLGMKDIGFRPTEEQKKRFSDQYIYHNGTNYSTPIATENQYAFTENYDSGGAGLFSTVDEYMKVISVLANGGTAKNGYVLLRPETIETLGVNRISDAGRSSFIEGRRFGYGWGLCGRVHVNPKVSFVKSSAGEFGWDGAAGAFCMIDPKKNIAFYFGTHLFGFGYGYSRLHWKLIDLVVEAVEEV